MTWCRVTEWHTAVVVHSFTSPSYKLQQANVYLIWVCPQTKHIIASPRSVCCSTTFNSFRISLSTVTLFTRKLLTMAMLGWPDKSSEWDQENLKLYYYEIIRVLHRVGTNWERNKDKVISSAGCRVFPGRCGRSWVFTISPSPCSSIKFQQVMPRMTYHALCSLALLLLSRYYAKFPGGQLAWLIVSI